MTPIQAQALGLILKLNAGQFNGSFWPSEVMAFCQVESAFRPNAYRRESSGVASYGLMQVLDSTAARFGINDPRRMFDPEISLQVGMQVADQNWEILTKHFGREPTYEEWAAAYNEGPGGVIHGRADPGYVKVWLTAQAFWAQELKEEDSDSGAPA